MKKLPDPAKYHAAIAEGRTPQDALRRAGYRLNSPAAIRKAISRLNSKDAGPIRPAVAALDPIRRAIWDALTPTCQEWLTDPTPILDRDPLPLPEQLSTPWLLKESEFIGMRRPATCPRKPWDELSRRQEAAYHDPKAR